MTLTSRIAAAPARRSLAIIAGLALAIALLPLAGTAQSQDPPPNLPCPDGTPQAEFIDRDTARAAHLLSIDCVAFHAISVGSSDEQGNPVYLPAGIVNRAQMATFIANTLDAAGFVLPDGGGDDEFDDIDVTVHRERINSLARAGIVSGRTEDTYSPNLPVTRAAMATFIVQAAEWAFDVDFEAEDGPYFADAIGTTHEENINTGFELELFEGQVAPTEDTLGIYGTQAGTRRDQMATFLSRLLDFLWIEQGIFGLVVDAEDGEPIAGADVTITDEDDDVVFDFTTGASGRFLADLDAGTYTVTADADGYDEATEEDVVVAEGEIVNLTIDLTATVPQGIAGTVTDQDGSALEGVTVTASDNGDVGTDETDEDGEYFLDLEGGTYTVTAELEGYGTETEENVEVEADQVTEQDFTLTLATGTIVGTVTVEDGNGDAIADATITVLDNGDEVGSTTTDADGEFSLEVAVGTYDVTADAVDFEAATEGGVVVEADAETPVDFALAPTFVGPFVGTLTADTDVAPTSDVANPGNAFPSPGDINFELVVVDDEDTEIPTTGREYSFTVVNTGATEVVACVRCAAPNNVVIGVGESHTFEEPDRERVRVDAAGETSVEVTASTTVAGQEVTADAVTAAWVEVDETPTGAGEAATFAGTVTAFNTGEDQQWYLLETGDDPAVTVLVEYTGGEGNTYLIDGTPATDLDEFEGELALDVGIGYATDAANNQTHDLFPVLNGEE